MGKKEGLIILVSTAFILALFIIVSNFSTIKVTGHTVYTDRPNSINGTDTYIREGMGAAGSDTKIRVGNTTGNLEYKSLIKFDVSSIPPSDTIVEANFSLYLYNTLIGSVNRTINIYKINTNWDEANANWTNKDASNSWVAPGASGSGSDYNPTLITSVKVSNQLGWYNFTITSVINNWITGTNYGLLIVSNDSIAGEYFSFYSSDYETEAYRPIIRVHHEANAPPQIQEVSINSNLSNLKYPGENVTFNVSWDDLEGNDAKIYVCNSSIITSSVGCAGRELCSFPLEGYLSTSPLICNYTVQESDNKTTAFWIGACDDYSENCDVYQGYFYVNHIPSVLVILPNGGETINQIIDGNYLIKFNVTEKDIADKFNLDADIFYGFSQNSTETEIIPNLNLSNTCTFDSNPSTPDNCSYSWNSMGAYGSLYLTIVVNDSLSTSLDSSNAPFNAQSLIDDINPNVTEQWMDSNIYSGKSTGFYGNATDSYIHKVWVSINTTPQTNLTMTKIYSNTYAVNWTAEKAGAYKYKIYANDTSGNLNDSMTWEEFEVQIPTATPKNELYPSSAIPLGVIKISTQIEATNPLKSVYAYLYATNFSFIGDYPQNISLGDISPGQTKNAIWFISTPQSLGTKNIWIRFEDKYSNVWNSSVMSIEITSGGGGGGYFLTAEGYPEVTTISSPGNPYYVEAYFKNSGVYSNADNALISLYDSVDNLIMGPVVMSGHPATGIYSHTYNIISGVNTGIWTTEINATKDGTNYHTRLFWKVTGGIFDVRGIAVIDPYTPNLQISVIGENKGGTAQDLVLDWTLNRTDTGEMLDSGQDTIGFAGGETKTHIIYPNTNYTGNVKITFIGTYSGGEKAGAYEIFNTMEQGVTPPSGGGGGGGGGSEGGSTSQVRKTKLTIEEISQNITLGRGLSKTIPLKIKNSGDGELTNIKLILKGLEEYYFINPSSIKILGPGEIEEFLITISIMDFSGKKDFVYKITSDQTSIEEKGSVEVMPLDEYFLKELKRFGEVIKNFRSKIINTEDLKEVDKCEKIVNEFENSIKQEKYVDAKDNHLRADNCLKALELLLIKPATITDVLLSKGFLLTWIFILIILAIIIVFIYLIYKKLNLLLFLRKEQKKIFPNKNDEINQLRLDFKIKEIKKKLEEGGY